MGCWTMWVVDARQDSVRRVKTLLSACTTCRWVVVAFVVAACIARGMWGSFVAGSSSEVKIDRTGMPPLFASNAPTALPRRSSRRLIRLNSLWR